MSTNHEIIHVICLNITWLGLSVISAIIGDFVACCINTTTSSINNDQVKQEETPVPSHAGGSQLNNQVKQEEAPVVLIDQPTAIVEQVSVARAIVFPIVQTNSNGVLSLVIPSWNERLIATSLSSSRVKKSNGPVGVVILSLFIPSRNEGCIITKSWNKRYVNTSLFPVNYEGSTVEDDDSSKLHRKLLQPHQLDYFVLMLNQVLKDNNVDNQLIIQKVIVDQAIASPIVEEVDQAIASPIVEEVDQAIASPIVQEVDQAIASPIVEEVDQAIASPIVQEVDQAIASPTVEEIDLNDNKKTTMKAKKVVQKENNKLPRFSCIIAAPRADFAKAWKAKFSPHENITTTRSSLKVATRISCLGKEFSGVINNEIQSGSIESTNNENLNSSNINKPKKIQTESILDGLKNYNAFKFTGNKMIHLNVFKACFEGKEVVVKYLEVTDETRCYVENEVNVSRSIKPHPNLGLPTHIFKQVSEKGELKRIVLVSEFYPNGEVGTYLKAIRNSEDYSKKKWDVVAQIECGVKALHGQGIVHLDLKPANMMVDKAGNVKIIDFGFSKILHRQNPLLHNYCCGTPGFMAPELFQEQAYDGKAADAFSLGSVFYEILTDTETTTLHPSSKDHIKSCCPIFNWEEVQIEPSSIDFLKGLVDVNPNQRTKVTDIDEVLINKLKTADFEFQIWLEACLSNEDPEDYGCIGDFEKIDRKNKQQVLDFFQGETVCEYNGKLFVPEEEVVANKVYTLLYRGERFIGRTYLMEDEWESVVDELFIVENTNQITHVFRHEETIILVYKYENLRGFLERTRRDFQLFQQVKWYFVNTMVDNCSDASSVAIVLSEVFTGCNGLPNFDSLNEFWDSQGVDESIQKLLKGMLHGVKLQDITKEYIDELKRIDDSYYAVL